MLKKLKRLSWSDGNTTFLRAARDGNLQEILEYLKGSTDINTSNPNGLNALHLASKEGHLNIVTELLRRGANVEAATKKGNTALHIASLAGHADIVKLLVENGAKVNVQAQMGFTPLYMASQESHAEVVKYLLANGASQTLATADGFTPLAVALQQGHEKVVTVLLEHDTKGKLRLPALHIAAKKDDTKSAALLLQNEQNALNNTTDSGFTPLHIASHYGNDNVGSLLIQKGADVNYRAKNNITPLHVASRWGKKNMVTLLLDNRAVIDERTRDGLTPLHCASRSGHDKVVDCLLERGAPYSAKTKNGLTPIHMAAQGDHVDCVRLLLLHKAPVDDVTVDYLTPLHVAAHCGNVKTAKLLLDRKCEPNARALNGFTPLHIACKKNRIKVVELLLKYGASIEATTESGLTPLHVASFMGHMNIVIYLIQHNANPDFPTVRGETALHLAARANQTDIIRILLRNGASVDARAREQQTPLHIAARLGNVDNVTLLLHHGASPDAVTKDLYTPLHIAAKEGHEEVASVLLDNGASHGLTTKKGFTPLHIAAKYGNIKVARLLLQKDANPDVQGKNGLTPLHVATHYNHVNVALLLLDHKASPHCVAKNGYTPLHIAAKKNQMDIATTLLEFGAKPDAESKNGFTPLHLAAQEGHTDMVSLLLEHKANVNSKAHNGLTPMHLAAQEDKVNIAEVLVKYGAEIDPQTKAGYTPLHTACHFGQSNMVRYLLDQGASVSSTTKLGYTPLHQAAQQGHVQVVNLLLKNKASPNAVTNNGQTALSIAQRLGYISVVDTLSAVTEVTETPSEAELKYKVVSPETMQETLLSDSEDEGGEDSISLERGESTSPLETSYNEKDFMRRHPESEDARKRMKSEMSTALRYPSYLEHGPDYEAEMQYFSGDTLSPHGRDKSTRGGDSVFGGDYSTLDRLDRVSTSSSQAENKIRTTDESHSELEYGDDQDYMEAQHITQSFASYSSSAPDRAATAPPGKSEGGAHFSSYSGSSFNANFDPDNVAIDRTPVYSGFLISFMVDARGGAMRGRRHSGVRIIIPPRKASMPTRVTCRLIKKEKLMHPLPLNEGEALAARILEMGPVGTKFLGQIVIEIPHFASLRGKERAIKILRSDNGEKWEEHPIITTDEAVNKALNASLEDLDQDDELTGKRVTRILTDDFPRYFAIVTKIREETNYVGEEGGVISSTVVPQVQAVFPEGALTKKIKVGLQAQPVSPELVAKLLGNRIAVSPIVTLEPRRRKFHKSITLTIPYPRAAQKGMINQYEREAPTLRVLYSISEGTSNTEWDDLTDQAQPEFVDDCVSFTTRVSGRYWLMDCQDVSKAIPMATELYRETITVPYMARFVVFAKRTGEEEGKLRMFCMTDDKIDKTLEKQEHFVEVARSRDVEVLEGRPQFVEMAGNLIPVTKSGDQLYINFKAFRENRLPCTVRIRDMDQDPAARVAFMKEPKVARGEVPQTPMCNLNISLPDMSTSSSMEMDGDAALELRKRSAVRTVVTDNISQAQLKLTDVADTLKGDWVMLAQQLDVSSEDQNDIKNKYKTVNDQALAMLQLWVDTNKEEATGNALETALRRINREDVVKKCMYNVETVEDEVEAAAARVAMDQSGFDNFTEEVGISQEVPMKRGVSLDVEYDEQDIVKESESAAEESQPSSEGGSMVDKQAPQAMEEDAEPSYLADDHEFVAEVNTRRPVAKTETKPEKTEDDFFDLINQLDKYSEIKEAQEKRDRPEEEKMAAVTELAARLSKEEQEDEEQQEEGLKDDAYETDLGRVYKSDDKLGQPQKVVHRELLPSHDAKVSAQLELTTAGVTPSGQMKVQEPAIKQDMELGTRQMPALSAIETGSSKEPELTKSLDESETIDKEPDMPKIVGHLQKDLNIGPVDSLEEKRERSGSSSSSSSSSSDSESGTGKGNGESKTSAKIKGSELPPVVSKDKKSTEYIDKEGVLKALPGEKSADAAKLVETKDEKAKKSETSDFEKIKPLESSERVQPTQPEMEKNIEKKVMPHTDDVTAERHGIKRSYSLSSSSSSSSESDSEGEFDTQKHVSVSAPDSKIAKIPEDSESDNKEIIPGPDVGTKVMPSETNDTVDTKLVTKPPGEEKEKKKDKGRKSSSSSSSSESEGEPETQKVISDRSPGVDSVKDKTKVTETPAESEFVSKEFPDRADIGVSVKSDQPSETKDNVDSKTARKPDDEDKKKKKSKSSSSSSSESDTELKSSPLKESKSLEPKDQININGSPIPVIKLTEAEPVKDSSSDEADIEEPKDREDGPMTKPDMPSDKNTYKPKDTDIPKDTDVPKDTDIPKDTDVPKDTDAVEREKQPDIKQKDKIKDSKKDGSSSSSSSSSESDLEDESKVKEKLVDVGKPDEPGSLKTDFDVNEKEVICTEPEIIEPREGVQVERQERFEIVEGRAVAQTVITISSKSKDDQDEKAKTKVVGPEEEKPFGKNDSVKRKDSSSSSSSESEQEVDDVAKKQKDKVETDAKTKEADKIIAVETVVKTEDKIRPDDETKDKTLPKKEKTSQDDTSSSSSSSSESESKKEDDDARRLGEIELVQPVTETMISSDFNEPSCAGPSISFVQTHRTVVKEETSGSGVPDVFQVERSERFETMNDKNITHRKPHKFVSFESSALQFGPGEAPMDHGKGEMDIGDDDEDLEELAMTAQEYLEQEDEEIPVDYQQQYSEHGIKQQSFDYSDVFDSKVPANETVYEETLEDGTVVKHRKIRRPSEHIHFQMDDDENNIDIIREEGPPEDEVDIEDWEEVLPDGTVHTTHKVRRHSVKHIRRSLKSENGEEEEIFEGDVVIPGTQREDIIETFEEPPRSVTEVEDVDAELDDGTKIKRHVVMNRMVHKIKTRQVSIDAQGHEEEEDYEIDEIIPGTESAFIEGSSSSSSSSSFLDSDVDDVMEADLGEVEEVLDDGTVIKKRVIESTETKKVRSRAGSIDETITRNITEERISPSPRSRSPVHFTETGSIDVDENLEVVRKTLRTAHLEAEKRGNVVESSFSMTEDKVTSGPAIKSGLMGQIDDANQRAATAQQKGPRYIEPGEGHGYPDSEDEEEGHLFYEETGEPEGAEGGDLQSTKLMMKKQVHTKTVIKDGQEQTFVHEEAIVKQDSEPPEELRDSMQQIIDQFMEAPPDKEPQQMLEHDV